MKNIYLLLFTFVFFIAANAQVTVNLNAVADNTIYENPNTNSNAKGANMFCGTNGGGSPRRALIKFDLSAIPAGASITQVSLTLNCNLSRSEPDVISLHRLTANWGEGTSNAGSGSSGDGAGAPATMNDATWLQNYFGVSDWTAAGGDYVATASSSLPVDNTGFYSWSSAVMVDDAQSWLITPTSNYGWILINDETAIATARKFGTRENPTVENRPVLSVTYMTAVPVTLVEFKLITLPGAVKLQWQTAQEINNASFRILHGADGLHFAQIGSVAGAHTSSTPKYYEFIHQENTPGRHYYKMEMIATDGGRSQSKVIQATIRTSPFMVWVSTQVTGNIVKVYSSGEISQATYQLINMQGTLLQQGLVGDGNIWIENILPGIYILRILQPGAEVHVVKFIKY